MIDKKTAENTIEQALSTGADFAEIFVENTKTENISMINGKVDKALSGIDMGAGIRLFDGYNAVYVYTNDLSEKNLVSMAKEAALTLHKNSKTELKAFEQKNIKNMHNIKIMPDTVEKKRVIDIMRLSSDTEFKYSNDITQTRCGYAYTIQNIAVINNEGLWAEDKRVRTRFTTEAIASSQWEKQSGKFSPGGHEGFELFDRINIEEISKEAARIAVTMLNAAECPAGKMPVVIDNGFGGVIFHESCGHSLEATAVAKNASVFAGKLGQQIASPLVTAIDDGTIKNGWGSANIDDEGTPCQKNILIENGILKSYLVDKLNGKKMNMNSTGSSRRQSYCYAPTSRMTNTFIANGKSTKEEIISNTEFGLYAKQMGGGSVEPATGVFNFAVLEGYIIRNGKICEPVRGATLIGKGSEILLKIDMVGNNLSRAQGMCGSISGSIPADVGQPMIRVSEITVGGRG